MLIKLLYRRFILYFLMFGLSIVALFFYLLSQNDGMPVLNNIIEKSIAFQQKHIFSVLQDFSLSATQAVKTLVNSNEVNNYLLRQDKQSLLTVNNLAKNIVSIDDTFYRVELLDAEKKVLISVYRSGQSLVSDTQVKGTTRSFIPWLSSKNNHNVWFSGLKSSQSLFHNSSFFHLLYASYPLYISQRYAGSIVFYFNMDSLLNLLTANDSLDVYLTNLDGKILFSSDQTDSVSQGKARFFQDMFGINDISSDQQLRQQGFSVTHLDMLYHGQGLFMFCRGDPAFMQQHPDWYQSVIIEIFVVVVVFSFCFGVFMATGPSRTVDKLEVVSKEKNTYMRLLDQYVPVFETDKNGLITRCNQAFCLLSQYSESELLGKTSTVLNFNKSDANIAHIKSILEAGLPWQGEVHYLSKRGEELWLFSTVIPIYDKKRQLLGYMSISTDKTDKKQLEIMAEMDSLTEIHNRVKLNKCLNQEHERSKRYGTNCSVIMIDIDFFKLVNDNYGHFIGDKVLYQLAILLNRSTRIIDDVGRWGGEEFMVVCPETALNTALTLAEKIRTMVESHQFPDIGHITISLGVEEMCPDKSLQETLENADAYLYQAKKNGRNCVVSRLSAC